jgi:tryptophan-rich sensory protein
MVTFLAIGGVIVFAILLYILLFGLGVPNLFSRLPAHYATFAMLFPTLLWISFASYLNFKILQLNRNN